MVTNPRRRPKLTVLLAVALGGALTLFLRSAATSGGAAPSGTPPAIALALQTAPPHLATSLPDGTPSLLVASGSLESPDVSGMIASLLPGGRQVGTLVEGGVSQGDALAAAPDGRHAFLVDRIWLADEQRAEWRLNELELWPVP